VNNRGGEAVGFSRVPCNGDGSTSGLRERWAPGCASGSAPGMRTRGMRYAARGCSTGVHTAIAVTSF